MTPLGQRIARQIAVAGPMSLAEYMALCLTDPRDGYYTGRQAIGAKGDFITAPEISQMFGELVAVWCVSAWHAMGRPAKCVLAEAGPGRGTLIADLARTARRFPDFAAAIDLHLIETSPAMIAGQREKLSGASLPVAWSAALEDLPPGPMLLIANEFLDALPVRQYVKSGPAWRERCVGLDDHGRLQWLLGAGLIDPSLLPDNADSEPDGAVFEVSPAREAWITTLAERLAQGPASDGGMALLIDYGHGTSAFGDTFQAVRSHKPADPLAEPGLADLTAHVDFAALSRAARAAGAYVAPLANQGEFLIAMGLIERAGQLGAAGDNATRQRLTGEAERLAHPHKMGNLFKVLALSGRPPGGADFDFPPFVPDVKGS